VCIVRSGARDLGPRRRQPGKKARARRPRNPADNPTRTPSHTRGPLWRGLLGPGRRRLPHTFALCLIGPTASPAVHHSSSPIVQHRSPRLPSLPRLLPSALPSRHPTTRWSPLRFASRCTLKGPGIFDRSRPASVGHFMRYLPWLAGRLTHRELRKSRGR